MNKLRKWIENHIKHIFILIDGKPYGLGRWVVEYGDASIWRDRDDLIVNPYEVWGLYRLPLAFRYLTTSDELIEKGYEERLIPVLDDLPRIMPMGFVVNYEGRYFTPSDQVEPCCWSEITDNPISAGIIPAERISASTIAPESITEKPNG